MTRKQKPKKGISLAKGPVGLIGLVLLAYGITVLIFGGHSFVQHALNGTVHGKTWLGLEVNGWSGVLFIAAGLLLLLGAPRHWGAKSMSLIVGLALGAVAVIALVKGHGALGIFAANHLTELVWGAAAVLLIAFSQLPRVGGKVKQYDGDAERARVTRPVAHEPSTVEHERARERPARVERESPPANGARTDTPVARASGATKPGGYDTAAAADGEDGTLTALRDGPDEGQRPEPSSSAPATASERPVRTPILPVQTSTHTIEGANSMTDKNVDKGKGRLKEAAGSLTGNKRLKNEGRADQAKGKVKNTVDKVADTLTGRKRKG